MQAFYIVSAVILLSTLVSWIANELPMEMPEDEFEESKDWSKL